MAESTDKRLSAEARSLLFVLEELSALVHDLDPADYSARPGSPFESSVGAHVRHALDHVSALQALEKNQTITYDRRERGTDVEVDRDAALERISILAELVETLGLEEPDRAVEIEHMLSCDGQTTIIKSTLKRELVFVFHHLIHHNAMIANRLRLLDIELPAGFGFAPATLHSGNTPARS